MTKLTGIRSLFEGLLHPFGGFSGLIPSLKQQCLLFDSIGFLRLDEDKNPFAAVLTSKQLSEIEWLKENQIIYNVDRDIFLGENESEFIKYLSDIGMGDDYWKFFIPIVEKSAKDRRLHDQKANRIESEK